MREYGPVTLLDGTVVDSGSEAWRLECEARHVLALPDKAARQHFLDGCRKFDGTFIKGILQRRGVEARDILKAKVMEVWQSRQAAV